MSLIRKRVVFVNSSYRVLINQVYFFFTPCCSPAERYEPCGNPGAPSTAIQSSEKAFFQAGETLSFTCRPGYQLHGEATIRCLPGQPSEWSAAPPACRGRNCDAVESNRISEDLKVMRKNKRRGEGVYSSWKRSEFWLDWFTEKTPSHYGGLSLKHHSVVWILWETLPAVSLYLHPVRIYFTLRMEVISLNESRSRRCFLYKAVAKAPFRLLAAEMPFGENEATRSQSVS